MLSSFFGVHLLFCCVVDLRTSDGLFRAAVPSGASTGMKEAVELRDGDAGYNGKSVFKAVDNVNKHLAPKLLGLNPTQQEKLDQLMVKLDGTQNKSKFGANAILAVSLAICKAGAGAKKVQLWQHIADLAGNKSPCLPVPAFNIINGGSHAGNRLAMQEFMIFPTGAESFTQAMKIGVEVYHTLKKKIKKKYGQDFTAVGDEGGFAPNIQANEEAISLIQDAIKEAGYSDKVEIGMDVAASEFFVANENGAIKGASGSGPFYDLDFKNTAGEAKDKLSAKELMDRYQGFIDLCKQAGSPMTSIEDPFHEDDWAAWVDFMTMQKASAGVSNLVPLQVVGDDLTVTNKEIVKKAIDEKACNALLLKVNQIGSVWEAIEAVKLAQSAGWAVMTSHRSGETEDTFIADLAVGLSTGQIKTGAPCRSERLAKYNQLLRIEEEAELTQGMALRYAGKKMRDVAWLTGSQ